MHSSFFFAFFPILKHVRLLSARPKFKHKTNQADQVIVSVQEDWIRKFFLANERRIYECLFLANDTW